MLLVELLLTEAAKRCGGNEAGGLVYELKCRLEDFFARFRENISFSYGCDTLLPEPTEGGTALFAIRVMLVDPAPGNELRRADEQPKLDDFLGFLIISFTFLKSSAEYVDVVLLRDCFFSNRSMGATGKECSSPDPKL